eukprot:TRINITY_DN33663_c0_g2_i1.p1 TRINITY_DN33663_c0_g2~~TRINITY_DN33663_c0_g2_i1.p1  ORF type:complete len:190 (-),score=25.10 TRINITY_DN33663_c0_g2_i1:204-773(-)
MKVLLHDVWRERHPDVTNVYTVWSERTNARAANVGRRIDYVLCTADLAAKCTHCEVDLEQPVKWSDHAPVVADLDVEAGPNAGRAPCALSSRAQSKRTLKALFGAVPNTKANTNANAPSSTPMPAPCSNTTAGMPARSVECGNTRERESSEGRPTGHNLGGASKKQRVEAKERVNRQASISKFFSKPAP